MFRTVLKDILNDQGTRLVHSYTGPSACDRTVDIGHDRRGSVGPTDFKDLLPDMTSVPMDNRLSDTSKHLGDDPGLGILFYIIQRFLDYMASKGITSQRQDITPHRLRQSINLLSRSEFETALDQEVAKSVRHQRVGLTQDRVNDLDLLFWG